MPSLSTEIKLFYYAKKATQSCKTIIKTEKRLYILPIADTID